VAQPISAETSGIETYKTIDRSMQPKNTRRDTSATGPVGPTRHCIFLTSVGLIMALDNFSWVIPQKLAGSALPGGRLSTVRPFLESDIRELTGQGVSCLVSLLRVHPMLPQVCDEHGLCWLSYPIEDFGLPDDQRSFDSLITDLVGRIEAGGSVCVHCRMGVGRTGIVLACVVGRLFGIPGQQAIRTVRKVRTAIETGEQVAFVEEFCGATAAKGS
jgi:hypothetical protein